MKARWIFWGGIICSVAAACGSDQRSGIGAPLGASPAGGLGGAPGEGPGVGGETEGASSGGARAIDTPGESFVLRDATLGAEVVDLWVRNGRIEGIGATDAPGSTQAIDASGLFIFPAFVDSHVHLTYYPVAESLSLSGVLAAVDLAAPVESLDRPPEGLQLLSAGPMITAPQGYPTQSWGRGGYGLEVDDPDEARAAVKELASRGVKVIKIPFDGQPVLSDETISSAVQEAHAHDLIVAAHALGNDSAARARTLGCDLLAHTPTQQLSDETIAAWEDGAVVSTLKAFGASAAAQVNLKRLIEEGTTVLYGTDLGNSRLVGIDIDELQLMEQAGLSRERALAAGTAVPAKYWGIEVGTLEVGGEASFVVLASSPRQSLEALLTPIQVFFRGRPLIEAL